MRKVVKKDQSLAKNLVYGNHAVNIEITKILLEEQHRICAYTETYLGRTDSAQIEHFDPTLKNTEGDGYQNYFICKAQWNFEKGKIKRWQEHQPVLSPLAEDFEERILYSEGVYFTNEDDEHATNLIKYLNLNDPQLTKERLRYFRRKKFEIEIRGLSPQEFFNELYSENPENVYFIRMIEEEFKVKINFL